MKSNLSSIRFLVLASVILIFGSGAPATAQYVSGSADANLPYGADEVLKLSRAGINEEIILTYVRTSGTVYDLRPADIVYLRDQGVSDRITNAMLEQRKNVQATPTSPEPTANQSQPTTQVTINNNQCPTQCDSCGGPLVTYAPPTPVSTVHVIPYPAARQAYFSSYRTWSPYGYYGAWSPYRYSYGPYRYYGAFRVGCGVWQGSCGHWHGCAHRLCR